MQHSSTQLVTQVIKNCKQNAITRLSFSENRVIIFITSGQSINDTIFVTIVVDTCIIASQSLQNPLVEANIKPK